MSERKTFFFGNHERTKRWKDQIMWTSRTRHLLYCVLHSLTDKIHGRAAVFAGFIFYCCHSSEFGVLIQTRLVVWDVCRGTSMDSPTSQTFNRSSDFLSECCVETARLFIGADILRHRCSCDFHQQLIKTISKHVQLATRENKWEKL